MPLNLHGVLMSFVSVVATVAMAQPPATAPEAKPATAVEWRRANLPNGMRLIIVHAPQAKRQATFSFLPAHIGNDDADRAQWSHLLEHMLIRTTDAEGLAADGVSFNGETTESYLRLETIAEPAKWKVAIERHARWLTADAFDAQRLEREKAMIAAEEQSTAMNGFTGKFAVAAWNQIVVHGREVARVHGDVQSARVDEVTAYARSHVVLDESTLLATIGPTPIAEVETEITRLLGGMAPAPVQPVAEAPGVAVEPRALQARWDLPTRHVLLWWKLPDNRPATLAAATGAIRAIFLRAYQRRELAPMMRAILPHVAVRTSAGTFMILNVCIAAEAKSEDIVNALRQSAAQLAGDDAAAKQAFRFGAAMAGNEIMIEPNFEMLAARVQPTLRDAVEGLWLLGLLNFEFTWGVPATEVRAMLAKPDDDAVAAIVGILRSGPGVLTLEPADSGAP